LFPASNRTPFSPACVHAQCMHRAPKPPLTIGPPTSLYRSTPPSLTPTRSAPHPPTWRGVASREPHPCPVLRRYVTCSTNLPTAAPHKNVRRSPRLFSYNIPALVPRAATTLSRPLHAPTASCTAGKAPAEGTHEGERSSQALPSIDGGLLNTRQLASAPSIEKEQQGATSSYTLPLFFSHQGQLVAPPVTACDAV
jgi:hypothetical protein